MSAIDRIRSALGNKNYKAGHLGKTGGRFEYPWLIFSGEDPAGSRKSRHRAYAVAAACVIAVSAVSAVIISLLERPDGTMLSWLDRDSEVRDVDLRLELEYNENHLDSDLSISVQPEKITYQRAEALFDECETWIKKQLSEKISFPQESPNGVYIVWQNSDFSYIGTEKGQKYTLVAQLGAGEFIRVSEFEVSMDPGPEDYIQSLSALSESLQEDLSRNDEGAYLKLPDSIDGVDLKWHYSSENAAFLIAPAGILLAAFIWFSRDDAEKRMFRKRKDQFENEVPEISFQLMLYLNAGLIAENALRQIASQAEDDQGPMYRALKDVLRSAELKNIPMISELYSYARETHSVNFIRFSTMVYEHAGRGSELVRKLEQERSSMWGTRQTAAKAKVKAAETKLCFPLILLLIALIIITAAPSFMSM